jgi:RND family efflux transporter MFP subunit
MLLMALSAPLGADPLLCLIEPDEVIDVGSPVIGVLDEVKVDRGEQVRKGQVVARLSSHVEQQAVEVARFRANKLAELTSSGAAKGFALREKQRAEMLVQKNFVSRQYLDQASTEASVSAQKLALAEENKRQAELELRLALAQLDLRTIRSPVSGLVMERYLSPGQRVEQQPIVKIAKVDLLRVEVIVPAKNFNQIKPGMTATVTPELPGASSYTAKVTIVDQVIDAASNSFRVRLELPNPGQLLPVGARCKADLLPVAGAEAKKTALAPEPKPATPISRPKAQAQPAAVNTAEAKKIAPAPEPRPDTPVAKPKAKPLPSYLDAAETKEAAPAPKPRPDIPVAKPKAKSPPPYLDAAETEQTAPAPEPKLITPGSGVQAKAHLVDHGPAEAKKIASTPEFKPDAPIAGPKPQAQPDARSAEILKAVQAWAQAWSARDADLYQLAYAKDFLAPDGQNPDDWLKKRRDKMQDAKFINVRIVSPQVAFEGEDRAKVTFRQAYRSDKFVGATSKTLTLTAQDGRWLIVTEEQ